MPKPSPLAVLDHLDLAGVTGGTRFYNSASDAIDMAQQLRKWNPDKYYSVEQSGSRWYVSNPKTTAPRDSHHPQ